MNKNRLTQIAKWLEAGAPHKNGVDGFDLSSWKQNNNHCGTTCCIAGAAIQFFGSRSEKDKLDAIGRGEESSLNSAAAGARILDIPLRCAVQLFTGELSNGDQIELEAVEPHQAAAVIRQYMETGCVDWSEVHSEQIDEGIAYDWRLDDVDE